MKLIKALKIGAIEEKYGNVIFGMGLYYLVEKGQTFCKTITEDEINSVEGNALMSKEFTQDIIRCGIELANCDVWDIFAYIKACVGIDGCTDYEKKSERFAAIAYNAIALGQLDEQYDKEDLCCELGCTEEEFDEIMEGMSVYDMEE